MNLPSIFVTSLTFESGHTGRSEKRGVPFFIRGGVLPSFLQKCALIHTSYARATCGACCGFAAMGQAPYPKIRKNRLYNKCWGEIKKKDK